ncbi:MAG TPA: TerC family protein [Candidatus Kapabacteria bacterium]|nr:TerC family protein [Candidatus Kapabacteria bacterium]
MFNIFSDPTVWASIAALTLMEIVLGVDNIIFISILASRLPEQRRGRARLIGLILAGAIRIALIFMIGWIIGLENPLFKVSGHDVTGRDLILMGGGLFLIYKSTKEIHHKLEGPDEADGNEHNGNGFVQTVIQIGLLNLVFSLDSIVTAVGMTEYVIVMIIAVVLSLGFMFVVGRPVGDFVMRHPSVKMLALSFLLLIGFSLAMEAVHVEIPKAYIYSAMAFSIFVEMLNIAAKRRSEGKRQQRPVHLRRNVVGMKLRRFDRRFSD